MYNQMKFGSQRIKALKIQQKLSYSDYMSLCCDTDLIVAKQSFCKTLWLMMMHHHTRLGYKKLNSSKDVVWTSIQSCFEYLLWPWPRTQQFFHKTFRIAPLILSQTGRQWFSWHQEVTIFPSKLLWNTRPSPCNQQHLSHLFSWIKTLCIHLTASLNARLVATFITLLPWLLQLSLGQSAE